MTKRFLNRFILPAGMQDTAPVSVDPSRLFSEVVRLFNAEPFGKSDGFVSWQFHEHTYQQKGRWDGDYIGDIIHLARGTGIYQAFGGLYVEGYNPLALHVPWDVRKPIVGDSQSSIDDFVRHTVEEVTRWNEFVSGPHGEKIPMRLGPNSYPFEVSVDYVFPNPPRVRIASYWPDPHVIVSVSRKTTFGNWKSVNSTVMLPAPKDEMAKVSNVILTSKGVASSSGCYGDAAGPLQHKLNEYIRGYVIPLIGQRV